MNRKHLYLIIVFTVTVVAMMVCGNVIIVAQRLAQAAQFPPLEYIIYSILGAFFIYLFVWPFIRIHTTPELPVLSVREGESLSQLKELGNTLSANNGYIPDKDMRKEHCRELKRRLALCGNDQTALRKEIEAELANRIDGNEALGVWGINKRITDYATSSFMVTAVSQNGRFDTLSTIYINIRMISDIVKASGFRPNRRQMFGLYANVLITALMTFMVSDALENTGDVTPFAGLGDDDDAVEAASDIASDSDSSFSLYAIIEGIRIPGFIVSSAIDGALNALMTLRIGFITRAYICEGADSFKGIANKRTIRRRAIKEALRALPKAIAGGSSVIGKKTAAVVTKMFTTA